MSHFFPDSQCLQERQSPFSIVEISVSCRGLADRDALSKSDPIVVLFVKDAAADNWMEFGRTEQIKNNLNPDFAKKFLVNYFFEERQYLRFDVYDVDTSSAELQKQDFLGNVQCTLGELVSRTNTTRKLDVGGFWYEHPVLIKPAIAAEELAECKEQVLMELEGKKLDKKDLFGKSDPFLTIFRKNNDSSYSIVHKTEVIKNTSSPKWKTLSLPLQTLCRGDRNRPLLFKCSDWDSDGSGDFSEDVIGDFECTLGKLQEAVGSSFELINRTKGKKAGKINVLNCKVETVHTFLDYINFGTQLNCTIAIDFTASNGDPSRPVSYHYVDPYNPNMYMRAIQSVVGVIQDYDSDKFFPVLGFGAKLPPDGRVSHEFFVNGDESNPHCFGLDGVCSAYQKCVMSVQLYGPTNFAPTIHHCARFAAAKQDGSQYFILLILTDGVITDMEKTKEAIVLASTLPLSIIIVGIGNDDFEAMDELDADVGPLISYGRRAERDIVQFVPFRKFIKGTTNQDFQCSQAALSRAVLAELPNQLLSYMKMKGILPGAWIK